MAKAQSYNWEVEIGEKTIYPKVIAEFSTREEGRIEVTDGNVKYKIPDQISMVDEVEIDILIKPGLEEVKILEDAKIGTRDIFVVGRNGAGKAELTYVFTDCGVASGKKSASDRSSKTEETQKFILLPADIERVE